MSQTANNNNGKSEFIGTRVTGLFKKGSIYNSAAISPETYSVLMKELKEGGVFQIVPNNNKKSENSPDASLFFLTKDQKAALAAKFAKAKEASI